MIKYTSLLFIFILFFSCEGTKSDTNQSFNFENIKHLALPFTLSQTFEKQKFTELDSSTAKSLQLDPALNIQSSYFAFGKIEEEGFTALLYQVNDIDYDAVKMAIYDNKNQRQIADNLIIDFFNKNANAQVEWDLYIDKNLKINVLITQKEFSDDTMTMLTSEKKTTQTWEIDKKGKMNQLNNQTEESKKDLTSEEVNPFYEEFHWFCNTTQEEITLTVEGNEKTPKYSIQVGSEPQKSMIAQSNLNDDNFYYFKIEEKIVKFEFEGEQEFVNMTIKPAKKIIRHNADKTTDIFEIQVR
jgi:hypothetical protein